MIVTIYKTDQFATDYPSYTVDITYKKDASTGRVWTSFICPECHSLIEDYDLFTEKKVYVPCDSCRAEWSMRR